MLFGSHNWLTGNKRDIFPAKIPGGFKAGNK